MQIKMVKLSRPCKKENRMGENGRFNAFKDYTS
jgi:hypothetical protein